MLDQLTRPDIKQFIREHENKDVHDLMLNASKYPDLPMPLIADQILSRNKARYKLPEWYEADGIIFPPPANLQQSSSESTARCKASQFSGNRFLDLTGGTGVDAYYFMEQFDEGVILEPDEELAQIIKHNFEVLGVTNVEVLCTTAEEYLKTDCGDFSLIYADPSRRDLHNSKLFLFKHCSPVIQEILPKLFENTDQVLIKASPMLDIDRGADELSNVREAWVISVEDEVKELIYWLDKNIDNDEGSTIIRVVDLNGSDSVEFAFNRAQERRALSEYSMPGEYIYDPLKALKKAGSYNFLSEQYALKKLGPNTHLYTSDSRVPEFPGRTFRVTYVSKVDAKSLRKQLKDQKGNLATRNYPTSVASLKKKLKMKDGGDSYVFAANTPEGYRLIYCERN